MPGDDCQAVRASSHMLLKCTYFLTISSSVLRLRLWARYQSPFLRLPAEIREIIYQLVFYSDKGIQLPISTNAINRKKWQDHYTRYRCPLSRSKTRQRAGAGVSNRESSAPGSDSIFITCRQLPLVFLSPNGHLFSDTALARVNRQLGIEVVDHLYTVAMKVVTKVIDFNFDHIIHFMAELPAKQQAQFAVPFDGTYEKLLRIELREPYDEQHGQNLERWLQHIEETFGQDGEIATAYNFNWPKYKRNADFSLLTGEIRGLHKIRAKGRAKSELCRLLGALLAATPLIEYYPFPGGY